MGEVKVHSMQVVLKCRWMLLKQTPNDSLINSEVIRRRLGGFDMFSYGIMMLQLTHLMPQWCTSYKSGGMCYMQVNDALWLGTLCVDFI